MKKRFKLMIEIDTDVPEAKEWVKIDDYISNEIDDVLNDVGRSYSRNYSRTRIGTSYKVSLRTVKKLKINNYPNSKIQHMSCDKPLSSPTSDLIGKIVDEAYKTK